MREAERREQALLNMPKVLRKRKELESKFKKTDSDLC